MLLAQTGDSAAYREVLRWSEQWLRTFYEYHGPDLSFHEVDRAVRDTISAVHQKRHTFADGTDFVKWLEAIARYKSPIRCSHEGSVGRA